MNRGTPEYNEAEGMVKINHFTRKGMDIKGIIHVGANDWFEYQFYKAMGIENLLGFEPLSEACNRFYEKYPEDKKKLINLGLNNWDGILPLHVTSGDGQSSSSFAHVPEYLNEFPSLRETETRAVNFMRFDQWIRGRKDIKIENYNCLVVDVEGNELNVLRGFGPDLIRKFQMLSVELSETPVYYDAPLAGEVVDWLKYYDFELDSEIKGHDDVFFINKNYDQN